MSKHADTGPDFRTDQLTNDLVVINANRQSRPNLPTAGCPFCPGGLEAPEPYDVRWFPNRWPALGAGRCEVVLYTPIHDASFWSLGVAGARRVIDLWAERSATLGSDPSIDYVLIFENRGVEVGATISHPHGQIYAFESVPPSVARELDSGSLDLPTEAAENIVTEAQGWVSWVPLAAIYPYELRLAPRSPVGALTDAALDRDALAGVLVDALARLDQFFDEATPYMMWIHQRPSDGGEWPGAVLHLHVTPLRRAKGITRFVAAAELGAEVYFNPVEPEIAARNLRSMPGVDLHRSERPEVRLHQAEPVE